MKWFVSSDIHSFFTIWQKALAEKGFDASNPEHGLLVCGDLFDRGSESRELLNFLLNFPKKRFVLIRGNHEVLMKEMLDRGDYEEHDIYNGTVKTVLNIVPGAASLYHFSDTCRAASESGILRIFSRAVNYYEIGDFIFVHGWIPISKNGAVLVNKEEFLREWKSGDWDDAIWINGMEAWERGFFIPGKTIVCGHYHCDWYRNKFEHIKLWTDMSPFEREGIIAMDACTAQTKKCNVLVIEDQASAV